MTAGHLFQSAIGLVCCSLLCLPTAQAQVPAFPGAEGFAANAVGGRGGTVMEVTNLNDSGPGSLRAALESAGPRIVVFRIGGTIVLESSIELQNPFVTVAGQSAPADSGGITLRAAPNSNGDELLHIVTHDVVLRYLRFRRGPMADGLTSVDGDDITLGSYDTDVYNIMVDHCSFSWAFDENCDGYLTNHNVTFQWSIISEALLHSSHPNGGHSKGLIMQSATDFSIHHCLFAHNDQRNPLVKGSNNVQITNVYVYDWGGFGIQFDDGDGGAPVTADLVGSIFKYGPSSNQSRRVVHMLASNDEVLYFEDNLVLDSNHVGSSQDWDDIVGIPDHAAAFDDPPAPASKRRSTPGQAPAIPMTLTPTTSLLDVLAPVVGASIPMRDAVDARIVQDVQDGSGGIIDSPADVGGWPDLAPGTPAADQDHDGMPDLWESAHGFNPNGASDGSADADRDGYTNVEEYLNGTDPNSADQNLAPTASPSATPSQGTAPLSVQFAANASDPDGSVAATHWDFSDGSNSDEQDPVHTFTQTGDNNVTLTVTDDHGASANFSLSVTVFAGSDQTVFSPDLVFGDRRNYQEHDSSRWEVVEDEGDRRYFLMTSEYNSPGGDRLGEYTVVPAHSFGDVVLSAKVKSADDLTANVGADYGLILGWQNDNNYYYAMFNRRDVLSGIYLVLNGQRSELANVGHNTFTDNAYHDVKFQREGGILSMSIDGTTLVTATDTTLGDGLVGVGSYNDSAYFDDIQITVPTTGTDGGIQDGAQTDSAQADAAQADSGSIDSAQTDAGLHCHEGETFCNGSCVDLQSDVDNCGRCGQACGDGSVCSEGACALQCADGLSDCSGDCVNLDDNPSHCGVCDNVCPVPPHSEATCQNQQCGWVCGGGWGGYANCNHDPSDGCETQLGPNGQCPVDDKTNTDDPGCGSCAAQNTDDGPWGLWTMLMLGFLCGRRFFKKTKNSVNKG